MKFNALIPELTVLDFEKSKRFYTKILGFNFEYERKKPRFAFLFLGNAQIMIEEKHAQGKEWRTGKLVRPFGRGINFQLEVKNIDKLLLRIKKSGLKPRAKASTNTYRVGKKDVTCKEILILDPDGYLLRLTQIL